jgi:hypothetical protein
MDTLREDQRYFMSRSFLLIIRNVSDKSCRENRNTCLCSLFFSPEYCAVLRDDVEIYGRIEQATGDDIIRRMGFACWITMTTDTHSGYIICIAFSQRQWLCERASELPYTLPVWLKSTTLLERLQS